MTRTLAFEANGSAYESRRNDRSKFIKNNGTTMESLNTLLGKTGG